MVLLFAFESLAGAGVLEASVDAALGSLAASAAGFGLSPPDPLAGDLLA